MHCLAVARHGLAKLRTLFFPHIFAIAACSRLDEALAHATTLRAASPGYRIDDLLAAFQFAPEAAARLREGAGRIGIG